MHVPKTERNAYYILIRSAKNEREGEIHFKRISIETMYAILRSISFLFVIHRLISKGETVKGTRSSQVAKSKKYELITFRPTSTLSPDLPHFLKFEMSIATSYTQTEWHFYWRNEAGPSLGSFGEIERNAPL